MMRVGRGVAVLGNATIWCVAILFAAIMLQGTLYFLPVVGSLCITGLVSIVLVSMVDSSSKGTRISESFLEGSIHKGKIENMRRRESELERQLELLDKRFIEGEVSEETYKELKSKLKMKLTQMTDAHVSRKDHQTVDEDTKRW